MKPKFLTIAQIMHPRGTEGEVKIKSLTDFPSRFKRGLSVHITPPLLYKEQLTIENVKFEGRGITIKFKGIDNRGKAEQLKGCFLRVPLEEAESLLPKGAYWFHQIIGLEVLTEEGESLGTITEILRTEANDVYVVSPTGKGAKEILIPAIKDVVKKIDLNQGKMIIKPLPGLLE
ncbi:MAG: ribosome maturation factor RimM [Actinomycetota bacterium]|nr:ribosome maturation factor RimM [Actinomycetota bacterium]MDI6822097.1 ribosome maturation factor RimM [Actinomycetota bacterium]